MTIKTVSTKDFTRVVVPQIATEIETTHVLFNIRDSVGYIRQVYKDTDGNMIGVRFIKVSGAKYSSVETSIITKIQKIADDIESDSNKIDGIQITEIDRAEYLDNSR